MLGKVVLLIGIFLILKYSLCKSKVCGTSSLAGFTKNLQEIQVDKMVKILDCPGVIFDEGSNIRLRNILKVLYIINN